MDKLIQDAVKNRRTYYEIGKDKVLSTEKTIEIIRHAVQYAPSAFNLQDARVLDLIGKSLAAPDAKTFFLWTKEL